MAEVIEGHYSGKNLRLGIVVSRFNEYVTKSLLEGALNELRRSGVSDSAIQVVWVPGAYEIPLAIQTLYKSEKLDAILALGCIIRGETSHYEHLAQTVGDGIQKMALEHQIPVGFGVITAENSAQAIDRAGGKHGNKGREAARSALEMVHVLKQLKEGSQNPNAFKELIEHEFKA
jgi:6,7-dimethyl-8-ribityllumazine synthase